MVFACGRVGTLAMLLLAFAAVRGASARELSLAERVDAQEAIERVYYVHQLGTKAPFDQVVTRELLEAKVHLYLAESAALREIWNVDVTASMLERETARILRETRAPERLRELFAALHDDPFVIQECFVRPVLVDRLAREFYASDRGFHAGARAKIEQIQALLKSRALDPAASHPNRTVTELRLDEDDEPRRALGSVVEERDSFKILVPLEDEPTRLLVAIYVVQKVPWDVWWITARPALDATGVDAVASSEVPVELSGQAAGSAATCPDDFWKPGDLSDAGTPPSARSSFTSVWTGSLMLVWGGWNSGNLATGARYDPAINGWSPISTANAPSARSLHSAVWTGTQMIVWGGIGGAALASGGRYDPASDTWLTMSSSNARYLHGAVWTGTEMIVWGGFGDTYLDSGGRYNPSTDSWTPTTTVGAPAPRYETSAVWTGTRMAVWGGSAGGAALGTGGLYDPAGDTWTPTSTANAPSARSGHTAVWTGSKMLIWGGIDSTETQTLDTGGQYDPALDSWTPTNLAGAPDGRFHHTAVWTGSKLIVWGGSGEIGHLDSGGIYDPSEDSWTQSTETNAPVGRDSHTAVWTGSAMVVWGGWDQDGQLQHTGGRFDPSANSWTPTSQGGSTPSARQRHSGIWTGTKLIVWGGTGTTVMQSGGAYDPLSNSWSPTTTVGAPAARFSHTAVWTGNRMVIWGGQDASGPLQTGGRYDPLADSWLSTTTTGAPAVRSAHTAVWTGSRMLVWGGSSNAGQLNSGGSYDPSQNNWSTISTVGAPGPRDGHTAVWTGKMMIVWGGRIGVDLLNTGGLYDPVANTWSPTASQSAPSPRQAHAAVWSGTEMLVWGGSGPGSSQHATGGAYSVLRDEWRALSTSGAPSARMQHSAVWTGSHMIVWGGFASGTTLGTGALYDSVKGTWAPVSNIGAMTSRRYHAAVWTGDTMLLWGGESSNVTVGTGGGYVHAVDDDLDGFSVCEGDCDDTRGTVRPGAPELCDALDNDCDQLIDEDAAGVDTDLDGVRNVCDNCSTISNADQLDDDADGAGTVCDCRPLDPTTKRIPGGFFPLEMAPDRATVSWGSFDAVVGSSTMYDVLRGRLLEWPVGTGASESCRASLTTQPVFQELALPLPGSGFYYLIRGRNVCGSGGYGFDSDGTPQSSTACP